MHENIFLVDESKKVYVKSMYSLMSQVMMITVGATISEVDGNSYVLLSDVISYHDEEVKAGRGLKDISLVLDKFRMMQERLSK